MKRMLCLLLVLVMLLSLCVQAFADEDVLFCRMCGKQIPTDSKVCSYCGEKVVLVGNGAAADQSAKANANEAPAASSAASPATQAVTAPYPYDPVVLPASTPVPGPFNSTAGTNSAPRARVYVTKSPTSESVPYGGSCMFIAHAANATSVTWYISNSDGSLICTAADAPANVSGLTVSGANSDSLYLSGIPSWWNGCQVQACFTGEGGPVYTDIARIWTYQPTPQVKSSGWSLWDWYRYRYWDDPDLRDIRWRYWRDFWDDEPNPPDVRHSVTLPNGASVAPEKPGPGYPSSPVIHVGHENPLDPANDFDLTKPAPAPGGYNPGGNQGGNTSGVVNAES